MLAAIPHLHNPTNPTHKLNPKTGQRLQKTTVKCSNSSRTQKTFKEKKQVSVDYDAGTHKVNTLVNGLGLESLTKRRRLRVEGDRFQKNWAISEVVEKVMGMEPWDDIDGLLNRWVGRFQRKNFPALIKGITQSGSLEHSIRVFQWMKNQKNYVARNDIYNMLIRLHARHNRTDQARGLFFEMQKWRCKPDAETYNALISAHGRAGQWRWAMNIMEDMLRSAIPPSRSTYNNLINACGSSGNWKEALKVCKMMAENGVGPDLVTHNIILSAYKNGAQYSKALSYFELMKGTHIHPDTTTLNIVIHCLIKLGHHEKAIDMFHSMREKKAKCRPDIVTFTSIIHLYGVCGQIENCRAVFNTMIAEGMKPNIVSYNAVIGAYASQGMSDDALEVFNEIKENNLHPDVVSYTSLLNAYGRSQQPEKASKVFKKMKKDRVKPNIVTYNALIDAYGSSGFIAEAVEVLRDMEENGIKPNIVSICTLLACCGRCNEKVKIDTILSAAERRGIELNTIAYNSAIGSYMNVGEYEKAITLYQSMRKKKVKPDSVTYTILISGGCKMSRYSEALKFIGEMMDSKVPLSQEMYSSAISAYGKQGLINEAESFFNMMKRDGCVPNIVTYTTMLDIYSNAASWEKVFALLQEIEANNIQLDSIACSALMRAFNKGGQSSNVSVLAEYMRENGIPFTDAIYFEIVSACSILQDWKTTLDLLQMVEPSLRNISSGILNQLLHLLGKSGKTDSMIKLFFKIVASGAEINHETYPILLKSLLSVGNWRKYLEVLQWMEDSGVKPSYAMYHDIYSFAERSAGAENATIIKERVRTLTQSLELSHI